MSDSRDHRDPETGSYVDETREPVFRFADEAEALAVVEELGRERTAARQREQTIRRYLDEAIRVAGQHVRPDGERISRDDLVARSGLARQTVYSVLGHPVRRPQS